MLAFTMSEKTEPRRELALCLWFDVHVADRFTLAL
jgi:hypothetical protein